VSVEAAGAVAGVAGAGWTALSKFVPALPALTGAIGDTTIAVIGGALGVMVWLRARRDRQERGSSED
jgi:hypothetical protein